MDTFCDTTIRTRHFFWAWSWGYYIFFFISHVHRQKDGVTRDTGGILTILAMCAVSGMAGGMIS